MRWLIRTMIFVLLLMLLYFCLIEPFVTGTGNRVARFYWWMFPNPGG